MISDLVVDIVEAKLIEEQSESRESHGSTEGFSVYASFQEGPVCLEKI